MILYSLLSCKYCIVWREVIVFFFNDTATTEIYTLSLHDALPICFPLARQVRTRSRPPSLNTSIDETSSPRRNRSEEHTSELQSPCNLVCRLLLEKKKNKTSMTILSISEKIEECCN